MHSNIYLHVLVVRSVLSFTLLLNLRLQQSSNHQETHFHLLFDSHFIHSSKISTLINIAKTAHRIKQAR